VARTFPVWPAVWVSGVFLAVYLPVVGEGFISDDFAWLERSRWQGSGTLARAFASSTDFYRPLVTLSFTANLALSGLDPGPFGLTNLALALACAIALACLARRLAGDWSVAVIAAAIWLFNFHGINMALLWISGRTALLVTLFCLLAAIAFVHRWNVAMLAAVALALLSKEEAVVLPVLFTVWQLASRRGRTPDALPVVPPWWSTAASWLLVAGYLALRSRTGAFWFWTAPDFYRPPLTLTSVATNILQYADRSTTMAAVTVGLACLAARRMPRLSNRARQVALLSASWFALGFALTLWLPVRSSLYVLLPGVGVALFAAVVIRDVMGETEPRLQRRVLLAGLTLLLLLIPVYRSRTSRWVDVSRLSSDVIEQLREIQQTSGARSVVIDDDEATRVNLANAWGALVPEMSSVMFDNRPSVRLASTEAEIRQEPADVRLRLRAGRLEELR
jgi:hypothetical protein